MASPQKENGFTAIANELLGAIIKWQLSQYEQAVLFYIIRKTYGYGKKGDWISCSQFVGGTGIKRQHVWRALKLLIEQRIVTKGGTRQKPIYSVQKDYEIWLKLPKGERSHHPLKGGTSTKGGTRVVVKGVHTKETITKERIQGAKPPPMKKNSFRYNENSGEDFEDVIDADSGEPQRVAKKVNASEIYWELLRWSEGRRKKKFLARSVPKQFVAFKEARTGGYLPHQLKRQWLDMESDKWWGEKGFDWMNVLEVLNKKPK